MSTLDIIRAWKDEEYREGLSAEQKRLLPENPAGLIELDDADLEPVAGGMMPTARPTYDTPCSFVEYCAYTKYCGTY